MTSSDSQSLGERLVGSWSLVSCEIAADDRTEYPFGQDAVGRITYDAAGHMAVQIMKRHRPRFASEDLTGGTAEEVSAAFNGYVAYFGTYSVDEKTRVVTHRITGSLFPNWVGGEQRREVVLEGDRLTLSTPPIRFEGREAVFRLVWQRVE